MKKQRHLMFFLGMVLIATTGSPMAQSSGSTVHPAGGMVPWPVAGKAQVVSHVDPDQMLRLVIGLQPPRVKEEEQFIHDLQDRNSPRFHHFLTAAEWNAQFSPSAADEQAVLDWAGSQGLTVTHRFPNRLLVDVEGSVATIEKALDLSINHYAMGSKAFFSNDRAPSIPAALGNVIHSVIGLNNFQVPKPAHRFGPEEELPMYSPGPAKAAADSGHADADRSKLPAKARRPGKNPAPAVTNGAYDPTDLYSSYAYDTNALYNLGHCCNPLGNPGVTPPESSIAIATVGVNNGSDFVGFHNQYPYLAYHYQIYFVDGTPTNFDGEGTLDLEWATAMSNSFGAYQDTAMVYLYEGATNSAGTWTDMLNQILSDGLARVFSNSHFCNENDCNDLGTLDTQHEIFSAMVGQGWTLVTISGDQGATVGCAATSVTWPGDDPYMLTVGGTTLSTKFASLEGTSETGWTGGTWGGACSNNDGGSGGGCSDIFGAPVYQDQNPACGIRSRSVPDVALNADPDTPQNIFVGGALGPIGGTSIAGPEMAGFFAQANAYLLYVGAGIGNLCYGDSPCAPLGQPNPAIYYEGLNPSYAAHYPFYDITSGCNSNDITALNDLTYYCAGTGYDLVTGWGSVNMLQLAWLFNTWAAEDFVPPSVEFQGPLVNHWYNSDQGVFWLAQDINPTGGPAIGVAGFTGQWDTDPGDVYRDFVRGCCDSYFLGPQVTTTSLGDSFVSTAGQGCHTMNVRVWDNAGLESPDSTYGPVCYDTIAPTTTAKLSGTLKGSTYTSAVAVTLNRSDASPGSGVASTAFQVDGGALTTYAASFVVRSAGPNTVNFYSTDVAGNVESTKSATFAIVSSTTTSLSSSLNPAPTGKAVTFTAVVTHPLLGTPTGTVTFKSGTTVLATKTLSGGKATYSTFTLAFGSHSITAIYNGATYFTGSTSATLKEVIEHSTTTTLASSKNPSSSGQSITLTATVTHTGTGTPTGTVTFKNGSTVLATKTLNSSGKATLAISTLAVGTHSLTAAYSGNSTFSDSVSAALKQVVNKENSSTMPVTP